MDFVGLRLAAHRFSQRDGTLIHRTRLVRSIGVVFAILFICFRRRRCLAQPAALQLVLDGFAVQVRRAKGQVIL